MNRVRVRVLVTGSRYWACRDLARAVVARLVNRYGDALTVVHGAAPGVDSAFAGACEELGVDQEPHPADWQGKGNGAGPIRNQRMVDAGAVLCIAVHRDLAGSKGTKDCCRRALAAGIPTYLVDGEKVEPRRLTEV